jgi:hypothetical protein
MTTGLQSPAVVDGRVQTIWVVEDDVTMQGLLAKVISLMLVEVGRFVPPIVKTEPCRSYDVMRAVGSMYS